MRKHINIVENILCGRLDEIQIGGMVDGDFPNDVDQQDLSSDQLDLFEPVPQEGPKLPQGFKLWGRMGEFWVAEKVQAKDNRYGRGTFVWIKDGQAASFAALKPYDLHNVEYPYEMAFRPDLEGVGLRVGAVFVKPEFRGQNLGVRMYEWMLENNVCDYLMADSLQTMGGVDLWRRLRQSRKLTMQVWDGERYLSRQRKSGRDFDQVYKTGHLIPWVCLKSKLNKVLGYEDSED